MSNNETLKRKKLKQRFASQVLSSIGILSLLGVALNIGIRLLTCERSELGGGCNFETAFTLVPSTIDLTVALGILGITSIIAGAILRSISK